MGSDFVTALDDEIASLEASLKGHPTVVKLEELKRVRNLYSGGVVFSRTESGVPQELQANAIPVGARRNRGGGERQRILDDAAKYIYGKTHPTLTSEIFRHLSTLYNIPGSKPKNNLSAMLSNSDMFDSHGRSGWTLRDSGESEASESANSSSGSEASSLMRGREAGPGGGT